MSDDLMAKEVEVDPTLGASALGATEQAAIEPPSGGEIINRERNVEGRQAHPAAMSSGS